MKQPCQKCLSIRAALKRAWVLYGILRAPGASQNGRVQAAWKAIGALCGRPGVMLSPMTWAWKEKP